MVIGGLLELKISGRRLKKDGERKLGIRQRKLGMEQVEKLKTLSPAGMKIVNYSDTDILEAIVKISWVEPDTIVYLNADISGIRKLSIYIRCRIDWNETHHIFNRDNYLSWSGDKINRHIINNFIDYATLC
jgi:hypothetical protein